MSLRDFFSCYVARRYAGDNTVFEKAQEYFWDAGRYREDEWTLSDQSDAGVTFSKTETNDGGSVTIRALIEHSAENNAITISVGCKGLGVNQLRDRFEEIQRKIERSLEDKGVSIKLLETEEAT